MSLEEMFLKTRLKILRFYIFTKKKNVEYDSDMSIDSLPDPGISEHSEQVVDEFQSTHSTPVTHSELPLLSFSPNTKTSEIKDESNFDSDLPLPPLKLTGSRLSLASRTATQTQQNYHEPENHLETMLQSKPEVDASETSHASESKAGNVQVVIDDGLVFFLDTDSYALMSTINDHQYLATNNELQTADLNQTIFFEPDPEVSRISLNDSPEITIPTEDHQLIFHQGNCYTELMQIFKKDSRPALEPHNVIRLLPNGEKEQAEGIGLLRDIFTEFWETFYSKCCNGNEIRVPFLRHDMREPEWRSVGKIICEGWKKLRYLPLQISKAVMEDAIFGIVSDDLIPSFLNFLTASEKSTIQEGLKDFKNENLEDLLDVLELHQCKQIPTADNIHGIIQEIAHKEMLQEPRFVIDCWKKEFQEKMNIDQLEFCQYFEEKTPSAKKILNALEFPEIMDPNQHTSASFLKRFIRGLDRKGMENFLRFCTGTNIMSESIKVEFTKLCGFERRPQSHTCGCVLKLPSTYDNFADMREEFQNVLSREVWTMDYI